jgi:hypothetical protein
MEDIKMGLIYEQEMAIKEMEEKNPTLEQIEAELKELEERKKELQKLYASKCDLAIREAIEKSVQEKKVKRISQHIIIVKCSDLIGNPWNVEFHDWYASKDVLLQFLSTKPAEKWHDCVIKLAESAKDGAVYVQIPQKVNAYYSKTTKIPISSEFIQAVLAKL